MKIILGGDSAGQPLVQAIKDHLAGRADLTVVDASQAPDGASEKYATTSERIARAVVDGDTTARSSAAAPASASTSRPTRCRASAPR